MPATQKLKDLLGRMPDPAPNGTYVNLDEEKVASIRAVVSELRKGGRDDLLGLIDLLVEPGKGDDIKPRYALDSLAVAVTEPGGDKDRADFAQTLASRIGGDAPKAVQAYLIEKLQLAGGRQVADTLGKALLDADLCDAAARALAAIREGAAEQFLAALPKVQGRGRLSVLKKLAVLREKRAGGEFRKALADADADIRIAAGWGLSRLADASAAADLMKAADAHGGWERINQTDACMVLAEGLLAAGDKKPAAGIYAHVHKTRTEPSESAIRQAAERGLAAAR